MVFCESVSGCATHEISRWGGAEQGRGKFGDVRVWFNLIPLFSHHLYIPQFCASKSKDSHREYRSFFRGKCYFVGYLFVDFRHGDSSTTIHYSMLCVLPWHAFVSKDEFKVDLAGSCSMNPIPFIFHATNNE